MRRYRPAAVEYSFGPGPWTPAIKAIILANIALFIASQFYDPMVRYLGVIPEWVLTRGTVWQLATYMFLHAGPGHILFNMLGLWMFGVELERMWGTRFFVRYYAVTGIGAGVAVVLASLIPYQPLRDTYAAVTIGASGALFGILVAYAIYFPRRPVLMFLLFPVEARYFVMIIGALNLWIMPGSAVSNSAHLGGLVVGYLYLKGGGGRLTAEFKYRYLKWRMNRLRRKFDVYSGGRSDWDRNIH